MSFTVTTVVDGDTFVVNPKWEIDNETGSRVRIANYDANEVGEPGGKSATQKLEDLIDGKEVELKNPATFSYGRLVCDVYLDGKNIVDDLS